MRTATTPSPATDHPRSRGVYRMGPVRRRCACGSSPLARGLQRGAAHHPGDRRIIPARAGFTLLHHLRFRKGRDHPRSRGVYPRRSRQVLNSPGSSPLARGLPRPGGARRPAGGIIPARAGFTPGLTQVLNAAGDHPRSRGVYARGHRPPLSRAGSSPLARGLLACHAIEMDVPEIIPARAGFTSPHTKFDPTA